MYQFQSSKLSRLHLWDHKTSARILMTSVHNCLSDCAALFRFIKISSPQDLSCITTIIENAPPPTNLAATNAHLCFVTYLLAESITRGKWTTRPKNATTRLWLPHAAHRTAQQPRSIDKLAYYVLIMLGTYPLDWGLFLALWGFRGPAGVPGIKGVGCQDQLGRPAILPLIYTAQRSFPNLRPVFQLPPHFSLLHCIKISYCTVKTGATKQKLQASTNMPVFVFSHHLRRMLTLLPDITGPTSGNED